MRGAQISLLLLCGPSQPANKPITYPEHQNLRYYLDSRGKKQPIKTPADWEIRRKHILANMQLVMGEVPGGGKRVPLSVQSVEEVQIGKLIRRKITYQSEPTDRVGAYLFLPASGRVVPAVLCLHQTTPIGKAEPAGLGGDPNLHYAMELAERGFTTLAPDYPNFGDYKFDPYSHGYVSATMKGIRNHRRALDLLSAMPEVDRRRIAVIGHSLGGHNALFLAAFEPRAAAVVTSCGFTSFAKYYGGNLTGWSHAG